MAFQGFTPSTFQFFAEIELHNDKTWFEENRPVYTEHVRKPLEDLVADLEPVVLGIDPRIDTRPNRAISRIYRDARRSKGVKYYDCAWISFKPSGTDNSNAFTYYVYVDAKSCGYGVGFYSEVRPMMERFRRSIAADPGGFRDILEQSGVERFELHSAAKKGLVPPEGFPEDLAPWYTMKTFSIDRNYGIEPRAMGPDLGKEICGAFAQLGSLYQYVWGPEIYGKGTENPYD